MNHRKIAVTAAFVAVTLLLIVLFVVGTKEKGEVGKRQGRVKTTTASTMSVEEKTDIPILEESATDESDTSETENSQENDESEILDSKSENEPAPVVYPSDDSSKADGGIVIRPDDKNKNKPVSDDSGYELPVVIPSDPDADPITDSEPDRENSKPDKNKDDDSKSEKPAGTNSDGSVDLPIIPF